MNSVLPFSAEAACAAACPRMRPPARAAILHTLRRTDITSPSTRLRNDVDQRRLAALDDFDRALERGFEFGRVADRRGCPPAHRFGELGIVDIRVFDPGADRPHVL